MSLLTSIVKSSLLVIPKLDGGIYAIFSECRVLSVAQLRGQIKISKPDPILGTLTYVNEFHPAHVHSDES